MISSYLGMKGRENFTEETKSCEKMLIFDFGATHVGVNHVPIVQCKKPDKSV